MPDLPDPPVDEPEDPPVGDKPIPDGGECSRISV